MVPTKAGGLNNGVAGLVLLLVVTGCAGWGQWEEAPSINLANIRVLEVKGLESAFEIDLRVFNRSDRPLSIDGIDCELAINGKRFAQGVANPRTEIPLRQRNCNRDGFHIDAGHGGCRPSAHQGIFRPRHPPHLYLPARGASSWRQRRVLRHHPLQLRRPDGF